MVEPRCRTSLDLLAHPPVQVGGEGVMQTFSTHSPNRRWGIIDDMDEEDEEEDEDETDQMAPSRMEVKGLVN